MVKKNAFYGWKPDLPDNRDYEYTAKQTTLHSLPPAVDLRPFCPPVYYQGPLGSCTANATAAAYQFELMKQMGFEVFTPSRLFIYYNQRTIEGIVFADNGGHLRDGIKGISKIGVCPETIWPYAVKKFAQKPPAVCYKTAKSHTAMSYRRVKQNIHQMRACLAEGYPIIIGVTLYSGFILPEVRQTGILNMPLADEKMISGHAVVVVGYDDATERFIVRNSWGKSWGMGGYFTLPYAYLLHDKLAGDAWTINLVA